MMSVFLTQLDQWALGALMMFYHLLGVQQIPHEPDPNWSVVEQWAKQTDGSYRLTIESQTIQSVCRDGRARYIVFPQTYEGRQEVFVDTTRIYSNEMDQAWHLKSVLDRILVNCDLLKHSKKVTFQSTVQLEYYISLNKFPFAVSKSPPDQFLFDLSYILSATISLFLSIIGTIVLFVMNVRQFKLLGLGIGITMLMLTHVPGYFVSIEIGYAHLIQMVGTFLIAYFYMLDKIPIISSKKFRNVYVIFLAVSIVVSLNHRATDQFLMLSMAFIVIVGGLLYAVCKKNLKLGVRANFLIVLTIAFFDVYRGQAYREGYANLAGLVIVVMIFEIINVVRNVYKINLKTKRIEGNLESERKLLQKINSSNEHLKSIIHDLKAPITSLNFSLQEETINKSRILLISKRFDTIFENLSNDKSNANASWYSVKTLKANLEEVCLEMGSIFKKISIKVADSFDGYVYYFTDDFKNTLSEILLNAFKAAERNSVDAEVSIELENLLEEFKITVSDNSGGVSETILKNLSARGITSGSSGLGLWMIKKRLSEVGGGMTYRNKGYGFEICLTYPKKNKLVD